MEDNIKNTFNSEEEAFKIFVEILFSSDFILRVSFENNVAKKR